MKGKATLLSVAIWGLAVVLPASAAVDSSLVGTWKTSIPSVTGNVVLTWKIESSGNYESWVDNAPNIPHETGVIDASNGQFSLKRLTGPHAGSPDKGTYNTSTAGQMSLTTLSGPSTWARDDGSQSAAGAQTSGAPGAGGPTAGGSPSTSGISPILKKVAAMAASTPAAQRYLGRYIPPQVLAGGNALAPQGGMAGLGAIPGAGFAASGNTGAAMPGSARRMGMGPVPGYGGDSSTANPELGYAENFERQGDWFNATINYENAIRTAGGEPNPTDYANAQRNHTDALAEMKKRQAHDPRIREMEKHFAFCCCKLITDRLAGKPGNTDINHTITSLSHAYFFLENSDSDNAAWYYLTAVYWCVNTDTMEYNYKQGWIHLHNGLTCKQITPSIKQKIIALQHHIFPAMMLQLKDLDRAKYDRMQAIVDNVEHPTITLWTDDSGRVVDSTSSAATLDSTFYGLSKAMLASDYPQFAKDYNGFIRYVHSLPNKGIPVPPGPGNDETTNYCPPGWEQKAFGPLDFSVGRL